MDTSISSGLIGGISALFICLIAGTLAKKKRTNGELKQSLLIFFLAQASLLFVLFAVWAFFYDEGVQTDATEIFSVVALFVGFGVGAIYFFGEYYRVKGKFDNDQITYHTPWTGTKVELWQDLTSAKFNKWMYWYSLTFKSGKKIRISYYMLGHNEVVELLKQRNIEIK